MKSQLEANLNTYRLQPDVVNGDNILIIEGDFREAELTKGNYNVCFFDVTPVNAEIYDGFFEKILPSLSQNSVVIFSQQSTHMHAEMLNETMKRHEAKFNTQWSEIRVSGGNADASKYYSGIRVFGIVKKAVATPKVAPKPSANTQVKNG